MTNQHPITPPPELVEQWYDNMGPDPGPFESFAIAAARWGADQELEACCEWLRWQNLVTHCALIPSLRTARRSKPPSLKEQALETLRQMHIDPETGVSPTALDTIRRALEQIDD